MRQFLRFSPDRGVISIQPGFNAQQVGGTFTLKCWDRNGAVVQTVQGPVLAEIAPIELTLPEGELDGSMVELRATLVGLVEAGEGVEYEVTVTTKQSGQAIADPGQVSGPIVVGVMEVAFFVFLDEEVVT